MASLPSHVVAALGIGACFYKPEVPKSVWVIGAACSVIPDLDVIGFRFGIHYGDFWGHRGFTHSLFFAALLAVAIVALGFRRGATGMHVLPIWLYFFLSTASHGLLDALTDGGLGVAFFSPFDQPPLLSSLDSDSGVTNRSWSLLRCPWSSGLAE